MKGTRAVLVLAGAALLLAAAATGQVPGKMNYQVMLTNDADEPLADQSVQMTFRLYEQEAGGTPFWTETQNVTTNSIGVVSVVLGSVNPMSFFTFAPMWLEVEVDGELMTPRRPILQAQYARVAMVANEASNADELDWVPAENYATYAVLSNPGSINNPANPLEWTKLKSVPAGFADGTDDGGGAGDGNSLDASDGSPVDVVRVEADGATRIGTGPEETSVSSNLYVSGERDVTAAIFDADSQSIFDVGILARSDSSSAIVGNCGASFSFVTVPTTRAAVAGISNGDANAGLFSAQDNGIGGYCVSYGTGDALHASAYGSGYSGYFEGGSGVYAEGGESIPVMHMQNTGGSLYGDALWLESPSGVSTDTWTCYASCYEGRACYLTKSTDDNAYAAFIENETTTSEGLYVKGTIVSTGSAARVVETARGPEAVFSVSSPDVEVMTSGRGRLSGGAARVDFDRTFSESVTGPSDLTVTVTPIGRWSAVYVKGIDQGGFEVRSESGDMDVEFHWVVVGRARGHEERPVITIPDPVREAEAAQAKVAEVEANRPPRPERQQVATRTLSGGAND